MTAQIVSSRKRNLSPARVFTSRCDGSLCLTSGNAEMAFGKMVVEQANGLSERTTMRMNLWETIDHRWLLRDARTAKVPPACPVAFESKTKALRFAADRSWEVVTHP